MDPLPQSEEEPILESMPPCPTKVEDILDQISLKNRFALFITICMGVPWMIDVIPTLAPAYMAPNVNPNNSFTTVQGEFNLTDNGLEGAEMISSVYFLGNMLLGQFYCVAADRIGRRPVLVFSLIVMGAAGVLGAFAPTFHALLAARFVQGSFASVITMANYVLCCESIGLKSHASASRIFGIFWVIGYCLITPIYWAVDSWRKLQFWSSLPCLIFGIFTYCTIPESFAFLISKGKEEKASKWIKTMKKHSNTRIEANIQKAIEEENATKGPSTGLCESFASFATNSTVRLHFLVQAAIWFMDLLVYTSLCLTAGEIGGDYSFILSGLVELPCYFVLPFFLDRFGRKPMVISIHIVAAVAMGAMVLIGTGSIPILWISIWLIAKFALASAFMCCFVYGAELFPTEYRNICLGLCAMAGNFGSSISAHCPSLDAIFPGMMFSTFAALCLASAALTILLPETKDSH